MAHPRAPEPPIVPPPKSVVEESEKAAMGRFAPSATLPDTSASPSERKTLSPVQLPLGVSLAKKTFALLRTTECAPHPRLTVALDRFPSARVPAMKMLPPSSRPPSPVPRLSPQGTPAALPYPILRRLSSTSQSARRRAPPGCGPLWRGCRSALGVPHAPGARRGRRRGALGCSGDTLPRRRRKNAFCFAGLDHGVGHPSNSCPRWKHLTH